MITEAGFWKDRRVKYAKDLTKEIQDNALVTIQRANALLAIFYASNPQAHPRDANSGWRPPSVNSTTAGASKTSHHMMGRAVDIDDDDEQLDKWLMTDAGQVALTKIGLWMEHPRDTPRWSHVQTAPPGSGRRVFYA